MLRLLLLICAICLFRGLLTGQDLDPTTIVCRAGAFTLTSPLTDGETYVYQWERSFDGGTSWGATGGNSPDLMVSSPSPGIRYRLTYAADLPCLAAPACRMATSATELRVDIPRFAQGLTRCDGDTVFVGGTAITTGGNHETVLITPGGCDSIVETFLQLLPAYNEMFFVDLCPGEDFRGMTLMRDTSITAAFTTVNGCDSTVTFEVTVGFPTRPEISGPDRLCAGTEAVLEVAGNFSRYAWSTGDDDRRARINAAGDYRLTLTDFTGCELVLERAVEATTIVIDEVTATDPACPGGNSGALGVRASGDSDLLYSIDGGEGFQLDTSFVGLTAGDYTIVVENADGCSAETTANLTAAPELTIFGDLPEEQTIERGDSVPVSFTAGFEVAEWRWNARSFMSCNDCPATVLTPTIDTRFVVKAIAPGGCSVEDSFLIKVKDSRRVYTPTAFSPNGDDKNDVWRLFTGPRAEAVYGFQVADRWGGIHYQQPTAELPPEEISWDGTDRGAPLPPGIYAYSAGIRYADGSNKVVRGQITLMR